MASTVTAPLAQTKRMTAGKILVIEDDEGLRPVMEIELSRQGHETVAAADAERALELLHKAPFDLIISDLHLPGMSGLELLKKVRVEYPGVIFVVMTAFGTVQSAVEAMRNGAYDYITKPIHPYELRALVSRALDHQKLIEQVQVLRSCIDQKFGFENIIGSSGALMHSLEVASRVAATDATVLIHGETGTGKELVAKAIHFRSARRDRPFVTINCGAIPRELLESELFGHVKGSFTGALTHKKGRIEVADGGTVFLDEIGEMPLELQVRVLRLIEEHEMAKVGAKTPSKVDVRIIAATHRNLEAMVADGTFREDLYYRLLVVPIELPPLRDRGSDVIDLVQHFLAKHKLKHSRPTLTMPSELLPYFSTHRWPGNVRQLENAMERLVLVTPGEEITFEDLPDFLRTLVPAENVLQLDLPDSGMSLDAVERELIIRALRRFGGNQTKAARFLDLSRRTLGYRIEKYGIRVEDLKSNPAESSSHAAVPNRTSA